MYDSSNLTLKLSAVIRGKNNSQMALLDNGIAYSDGLTQEIIKQNENSNIVKAQKNSTTNVMTNQPMNQTQKSNLLHLLVVLASLAVFLSIQIHLSLKIKFSIT